MRIKIKLFTLAVLKLALKYGKHATVFAGITANNGYFYAVIRWY